MEERGMEEKRQFWKGLALGLCLALGIVLLTLLLRGGVYFLAGAGRGESSESHTESLDVTKYSVQKKLTEIGELVNLYYLNGIDEEQVETYLYKGMIAGLGDAYAGYYTQEEYRRLLESTNGSYCGIGVELLQRGNTGLILVTRVFEGSPAAEAGLLSGDIICQVDGKDVLGEDLPKTVALLKGEEATKVSIAVARDGEEDYLEFEMERRTIEVPTVSYEMLEDRTGYIEIASFDDVTVSQFETALADLEGQGMKALVIDLRNNGGGLYSSVCKILDRLLPEGLLVYTEDKYGNRVEATSDGEVFFDKPMAVLINGNSASASEIFAGAIKDYGAGTLVGTRTFGKGIVQKIYPLSDGTAVKLTVSKYYTPNGNNIHGIGIEPDVEEELEEGLQKGAELPREQDNQLQKALEILKEKQN